MRNLQDIQIKSGSSWEKVCPFPVGFIYLSQNSTSPASTFGGTWSALNEDRFLRPSNAWTTGGSKKISVSQMPSHTHSFGRDVLYTGADNYPSIPDSRYDESVWWYTWSSDFGTEATGGGQITGRNIEIVTLGTEQPNLYLLDGGVV